MKIIGLSKDLKVQQYLKGIYGLEVFEFDGLPAFRKNDSFFLGGFKSFYSVIVDEDNEKNLATIKNFFTKYPEATCCFSISSPIAKGTLVHYLLRIDKGSSIEGRFDLYNKKTRNQVRKSYLNDLRVEVGQSPYGFYDLYVANMKRLKSIAKDRSHFERLEKFLGESIICISIFDGDTLIGCNYAIVSGNYATLLLNLSNSQYWNLNINDRLYDELIVWAIQHNIEFVDFGPSVRGDEGHNHFKEGFGAIRRTIIDSRQMTLFKRVQFFIEQKARNLRLRLLKFTK